MCLLVVLTDSLEHTIVPVIGLEETANGIWGSIACLRNRIGKSHEVLRGRRHPKHLGTLFEFLCYLISQVACYHDTFLIYIKTLFGGIDPKVIGIAMSSRIISPIIYIQRQDDLSRRNLDIKTRSIAIVKSICHHLHLMMDFSDVYQTLFICGDRYLPLCQRRRLIKAIDICSCVWRSIIAKVLVQSIIQLPDQLLSLERFTTIVGDLHLGIHHLILVIAEAIRHQERHHR